jgi:hypothetical protein
MKVPLVLRARITHGKTALRSKAHATLSRPSHPKPNVRDDAYVPLAGSEQRRGRPDWEEKERNLFLRGGLDEANQVETPQQITVCVKAIFQMASRSCEAACAKIAPDCLSAESGGRR